MKTPDEIKKGLLVCSSPESYDCPDCTYYGESHCGDKQAADALDYIQQLETKCHQLERERDALLEYLTDTHYVHCSICKHNTGEGAAGCKRIREVKGPCFEWRGVKEE